MEIPVKIEGPEYGLIQAWVDPHDLETVASLDAVKRITPPDYGHASRDSKLTEGYMVHRANLVADLQRAERRRRESGGLSNRADAWTTARASGDLPANIQINVNLSGESHEGTASVGSRHRPGG